MGDNLDDFSNVEFIDSTEREYFEEAKLGEDVASFLNSAVGRYLHYRAKLEVEEVKDELLDFDPYSAEGRKQHAELQKKAAAAKNFMRWCSEAIKNGDMAYQQLQHIADERR